MIFRIFKRVRNVKEIAAHGTKRATKNTPESVPGCILSNDYYIPIFRFPS
jgi:hypothetical protein